MPLGIIVAFAAFTIFFTLALGASSAAPWFPTRRQERDAVVRGLPLKPGAVAYDLGCGDGGMLFALADAYPGIRAVGYKIALPPLALGWWRKRHGGAKYAGVSLRWRDFWARDFSDADAVFVFLMRPAYPRLIAKLARELRDDAVVVLECWPFDGIAHERVLGGDGVILPMYVYRGAALRTAAART
ncbi:MAG: hypothetical protein RLZZ324_404 [Candidatus Parcubacteria bacterium]|jgi:cyclopropane fatty-acyl-phospholipid synthase-like methyltransferase